MPTPSQVIVEIVTDDQDNWTNWSFMTNLMAGVAAIGLTFTNCHTDYSLCSPSRLSHDIFWSAHNHGVISNGTSGGWAGYQPYADNTIVTMFQNAGWRVVHIGKLINNYETAIPGHDPLDILTGCDHFVTIIGDIALGTASFIGDQMTLSAVTAGEFSKTDVISGTGIPPGITIVEQTVGNPKGGAGVYTLSGPVTGSNVAVTARGNDVTTYTNFTLAENGVVVDYASGQYTTDVFFAQAAAVINGHNSTQPIYIRIYPNAPHSPAIPPARYENTFNGVAMPRNADFNQDLSGMPMWVQIDPETGLPRAEVNFHNNQDSWRRRCGCVLAVDDGIGLILQTLSAKGWLPVTTFVVIGDNGKVLGQKRFVGKDVPWKAGTGVPLWMMGPGIPVGICNKLINNLDLGPTLCAIAGITPTRTVDGLDLSPLFLDPADPTWRTGMWIGCVPQDGVEVGCVRTENWLYAKSVSDDYGEAEELYYEPADPFETANQASNPSYANVLSILRDQLDALEICVGGTCTTVETFPGAPPTKVWLTGTVNGQRAFRPIDAIVKG